MSNQQLRAAALAAFKARRRPALAYRGQPGRAVSSGSVNTRRAPCPAGGHGVFITRKG